MPSRITLNVTKGALKGQAFAFEERDTAVIGRAKDCHPRLPGDEAHKTISRHHCLLDVNPPDVRIRDFGSLNGTYVNGAKIGQRCAGQTPEEGAKEVFPEYNLKDGDTIRLGKTELCVSVFVPATCAQCSAEISEDRKAGAERSPGVYQCEGCRKKAEASPHKGPLKNKPKLCSKCGRDVSAEVGGNRQGAFVCAACQADPLQIVKLLLEMARSGNSDLLTIEGYSLLKELGRGGMGAVFLARHDRTGERVALKVMLPKVPVTEEAKERFLREVRNTQALKHRNVVELRDSGCSQGTFFFTLELCDGGSADKLMERRGGTLGIEEAGRIALQALEGLEYAHNAEIPCVKMADGSFGRGRGLVHRDLKPHNIFLSGSETAPVTKVGDFGLAKAFDMAGLSGQTRTGALAGTPSFMPRQQVINFLKAKPEVDVWAMAASLYAMLTRFAPRDFPKGRDPWQVALDTKPVPIRQRKPSIPRKLAGVIDEALVDDPAIRFKTAAAFRAALERVL
jgi:serine/threonine-protein kinase